MTSHVAERFLKRLEALRGDYLAQLERRAQALGEAARLVMEGREADGGQRLRRVVHSIAGTGATFGFPELSQRARALELRLTPATDVEGSPPFDRAAVGREALALAAQAHRLSMEGGRSEVPRLEPRRSPLGVGVVDEDASVARETVEELSGLGCPAHAFADVSDLLTAAAEREVWAVVAPLASFGAGGPLARPDSTGGRGRKGGRFPVLMTASRCDLETRLAVLRAGGDACVAKPLSAGSVLRALERAMSHASSPDAKVLMVGDDGGRRQAYATALREAGIDGVREDEPERALAQIQECLPDLVVLDAARDRERGIQLAAAFRQVEGMDAVPLLLVSGPTGDDPAPLLGTAAVDGILTPSMGPASFVDVAARWIARGRLLRSRMVHDCLTGLPGARITHDMLEREVLRATRRGETLCIAVADVDGLDALNRVEGHLAGNRRIVETGLALQAGLSPGDFVGRVGGDEFLVLLADGGLRQAECVFEEVGRHLSEHRDPFPPFAEARVSFGLAELGPGMDTSALLECAWHALFMAKARGGNRVEVAGAPSLASRPIRALLVSGDAALGERLQDEEFAEDLALTVAGTSSGAAKALSRAHPDVVLVDAYHPADGFSLCGELRRRVFERGPICLLTATGMRHAHRRGALACGAAALLERPLSAAALTSVVSLVLHGPGRGTRR